MNNTPETDAETMSDGVEMLTSQSDSVALYQKLCDAVCEIQILRRERDEARFLLKAAQSALDAIHLEVGGWIKKMKENTD
jgi:hypothetical protein